MNVKTLFTVNRLLNHECAALQWFVNQFDNPAAASTPEGQRAALHVLGQSMLRTNQLLNALVAEVGNDAVAQQLAERIAEAEADGATVVLLA